MSLAVAALIGMMFWLARTRKQLRDLESDLPLFYLDP